ncbi:hypothetical protein [Haloplanus salinarum]|uniref:hypothetical protein n=1 Tax=Haloplanus salinarum TaxID=1912324 RepID=UPI00214B6FEF|nr:hypothetical protein [Haloplanus salinarum]
MSPTTRLVALAGTGLLATSALAACAGLALLAWLLMAGATAPRVMAAMVAFGLALSAGLVGVVARKHAAGTLLPSDVDKSVGFRGGQGGL